MKMITGLLLIAGVAVVNGDPECRFAPTYNQRDLLEDRQVRLAFQRDVLKAESRFIKELGVDPETGLTVSGYTIDQKTGMPKEPIRAWSESDEAIHVGLLARALEGLDGLYTQDEAIAMLMKKVWSLDLIKTNTLRLAIQKVEEALAANHPREDDLLSRVRQLKTAAQVFEDGPFDMLFVLEDRTVFTQPTSAESLASLYFIDEELANAWHHDILLNYRTQTAYGLAMNHTLTWRDKSVLLAMLTGSRQSSTHLSLPSFPRRAEQFDIFGPDYTSCRFSDIPANFAWGVSTAAYQIEGAAFEDGRGSSVWDDFCKLNGTVKHGDTGDVADDFYHRYKEDVATMKKLGLKNFRMSLSWPRILPKGTTSGGVNGLGVQFYNFVINELLAAGITPWVTLHHWDTPSALHNRTDKGSFLSKDIVDQFDNYADFVFGVYGDRVKHWITLNEPQSYSVKGYSSGIHAPGRCSDTRCIYTGGGGNSTTEPYIASHNLILAHAKAARTYKTKYQATQGGIIGITANSDFTVPYNISDPDDVEAAGRSLAFVCGWFFDPLVFGRYPPEMLEWVPDGRLPQFTKEEAAMVRGSIDYIGINTYTTSFVGYNPNCTQNGFYNDSCTFSTKIGIDGKPIGPRAESIWLYVYPPGLRGILNWFSKRYNSPPIYIFENGVSVPNESEMPISQAIHDTFRIDFYKAYIKSAFDAVNLDGIDLRGYFAWSFMDNFEWSDGYGTRFGMTYVDYKDNQRRYTKDSMAWYSQFIRSGSINAPYRNEDALQFQ